MPESVTYVRIVGEPFLSRAREYREKRAAWHRAWNAFAQSKGAPGFSTSGSDLAFKGKPVPEGWTKPRGEDRFSHPKAKSRDVPEFARMQREHRRPPCADVFGDAIPHSIEWEEPDGSRRSCGIVGMDNLDLVFNKAWVGFAGETFIGFIPDPEAERQRFAKEHPERRIVGEVATWALPEGLVRITEAEKDLIYAEHKVAEERAKSAA